MHQKDVMALSDVIRRSRMALEKPRRFRAEVVKQYVGKYYSDDAAQFSVPVPMIGQYIDIVSRFLVSRSPRVAYSSHNPRAARAIEIMEEAHNDFIRDNYIAETLHRLAKDALISVGIAQVALATPSDVARSGYGVQLGDPYLCPISLDDFFYDSYSRTLHEAAVSGYRDRMPLDVAREWLSRKLEPDEPQDYNQEGDERLELLARGQYGLRGEHEPHVTIWRVYHRRQRKLIYLRSDMGGDPDDTVRPLLEEEWIGPECGPFHYLGFHFPPDNAMPVAPSHHQFDLHVAINNIYRKLIMQSRDQKRVTLLVGLTDAENQEVMESRDGDTLHVSRLDGIQIADMNGPNAPLAQMGIHFKDLFSTLNGNLELLAGAGPQSKTATQDEMLNQNASRMVADMQDQMVEFTDRLFRAMGWYHWRNPYRVWERVYSPTGGPERQIQQLTIRDRMEVPWEQVRLQVDPYSMQHVVPSQKAAMLTSFMQQVVMPLFPLLQQQGMGPDMQVLMKKYAKYLNMPDLPEVLRTVPPPTPESQGAGGEDVSPTRFQPNGGEYVRRSESQGAAGREAEFANNMQASGESMMQNGAMQ